MNVPDHFSSVSSASWVVMHVVAVKSQLQMYVGEERDKRSRLTVWLTECVSSVVASAVLEYRICHSYFELPTQ